MIIIGLAGGSIVSGGNIYLLFCHHYQSLEVSSPRALTLRLPKPGYHACFSYTYCLARATMHALNNQYTIKGASLAFS